MSQIPPGNNATNPPQNPAPRRLGDPNEAGSPTKNNIATENSPNKTLEFQKEEEEEEKRAELEAEQEYERFKKETENIVYVTKSDYLSPVELGLLQQNYMVFFSYDSIILSARTPSLWRFRSEPSQS